MADDKTKSKRKSRKEKLAKLHEQVSALEPCETQIDEADDDFCLLADEIEAIKNRIRKREYEEAATYPK